MDPSEWALARIGLKVSIFRSMVLVVSSLQQMYLFYYHIHLLAQDIARTITEISMSTHLLFHRDRMLKNWENEEGATWSTFCTDSHHSE